MPEKQRKFLTVKLVHMLTSRSWSFAAIDRFGLKTSNVPDPRSPEMKGQLGLCDYQGTRFESYERYITLALLDFLTLEYERMRGLQKRSANAEPRGGWAAARTSVLLQTLRQETLRADVHWQQECLKTPSGRRGLKKALARAK